MATKKKTTKKKSTAKKTTRKSKAKSVKAPVEEEAAPVELNAVKPPVDNAIQIRLSETLRTKVSELAEEEGISPEELIQEMVSEATTLRAFDQWEKRQHLRGNSPQMGNSQNHGNGHGNGNNNNRRGNRNRNRKNMNHSRYQNLMEDNSSFLEYVRNQEKKGGR